MVERIARLLAPPLCVGCDSEGSPLCGACRAQVLPPLPRCTYCKKYNQQKPNLVCERCSFASGIDFLTAAGRYELAIAKLVGVIKFYHQSGAAIDAAEMMVLNSGLQSLALPVSAFVTSVPSPPHRIRQRGFDHARMIAQEIAGQMGLSYKPLLHRKSKSKQIGSTRKIRILQAMRQFGVNTCPMPSTAVLIDDVVTTGATFSECAKLLKLAGVDRVICAALAQD